MIGTLAAGLYGTGVPPVTNSYESIATTNGGGASSITFSSLGSFKHLQLRAIMRTAYAGDVDYIGLQFNGSGGTGYSWHTVYGNGASAAAAASTSQPSGYIGVSGGNTAGANMYSAAIVDILDVDSTSKNKTVRTLNGMDRNGAGSMDLLSSAWYSTAAVTSLTIYSLNGAAFASNCSFALYGIKG